MMEFHLRNQLGSLESKVSQARLSRQLMFCWSATAAVELLLLLSRSVTRWNTGSLWWVVLIGGDRKSHV